ncbi:uncharacterized protein IL334_000238 [Kwoniella shivajii]|uniref:MIF4G domain-containing protein n=1 Tax=Kwoniella shivajii TaxID=564305 RepID=A0ABZ1CNR6_9TREE|nr:hypothetical protein IL334_000238 [Kwoniella shivajii]
MTATTSNYFQVALSDDRRATNEEEEPEEEQQSAAESSTEGANESIAVTDKAEIRRQRIAAAVERSKTEYQPEHAYTERGWFQNSDIERNVLSKPKVDRQHLEYIVTSLYYSTPPRYTEALKLILEAFDSNSNSNSKPKSQGGLSRELLDTGLRCSLACKDVDGGLKLADSSKTLWKGQFAGISASSSDIYLLSGKIKYALTPLLTSLSGFGLHEPILRRLSYILNQLISSDSTKEATAYFLEVVDRVIEWRKALFQKPLFEEEEEEEEQQLLTSSATSIPPAASINVDMSFDRPIDCVAIVKELDLDDDAKKGLEGTWSRLSKGFKGDPEPIEKSVREL